MIEPFQAVVVQACIQEPHRDEDMRQQVRNNIWRQVLLLRRFKFSYGRMKLVLMPELATHGLDIRRKRGEMVPHALEMPGPDVELYQMAAREFGVYLAATGWERDPHWPETYFLTAFLIDPKGDFILKQRMINGALFGSGAAGMYSEIARVYGEDGPFGPLPVVDTEIGKIGVVVGGNLGSLEAARVIADKGAEIILHPQGERNMETSIIWQAHRTLSALENQAVLVSANIGQYIHQHYRETAPDNADIPERLHNSTAWAEFEFMGRSQIIDHTGKILAFIPAAGESATGAVIDIERLRADRQKGGWFTRRHGEAYAREYAHFEGAPIDTDADWDGAAAKTRARVKGLFDSGLLTRAEAYAR